MMRQPATIELELRPTLDIVPIVRRFVEHFVERILGQADAASRMALAASELLENAAKFTMDGLAKMRLACEPVAGGTRLSIRTVNRAIERDRDNVMHLLEELGDSPDPADHYQELMRKSARRRQGSGLGLVRVWVEAEMRLSYKVSGDTITLDAVSTLPEQSLEPRLPSTASAEFGAVHALKDGVLTINMTGSADAAATLAIEHLVGRTHEEVLRLGLTEVVVDLTALGLMTSSCFKSFVSWIVDVSDLPVEQQYRIRLRGSAAMLWQRRSLQALKRFGDDIVVIEGLG
jgi:anti-sigma regulatory factor (Ser/Thr protein kinase)